MSSLWDSFGQKISDGSIRIEEMVELIVFCKEFDELNANVLALTVIKPLSWCKYTFTDWDAFEKYMHGQVNKQLLEYFISTLHDFDHANEQIVMYSFSKDKHYWKKHKVYRSWMGTFKDGKWKYSKEFIENHNKVR